MKVSELRCGEFLGGLGLGARVGFSWKMESEGREVKQEWYQVQVSMEAGFGAIYYDSDVVKSGETQYVECKGLNVRGNTRYYVRVRAEDNRRERSEWAYGWFETGIWEELGWRAEFIGSPTEKAEDGKAMYFRSSFKSEGTVRRARAYGTALGMYELHMNGVRVGDAYFTPGWTSFNKRLQVQEYDVTELIQPGLNAIGAVAGCGWYKGNLVWKDNRCIYGDRLAIFLQLHIEYEDGHEQVVVSDESWQCNEGAIQFSELYHGETYDARLETDWCGVPEYASFIDSGEGWHGVEAVAYNRKNLLMQTGPYVRPQEVLKPIEKIITPEGDKVFDFGQNAVGWCRVRVQGKRGARVRLFHAEILDKDGNFYTENMRTARNEITYILAGTGEEVFEPHFTFEGCRYVRVDEFPGEPELDNLEFVVVHSDMARTGTFECSNQLVNQLAQNVLWGLKGNFVDVPTDCPQRDERLGWTGDAQVFIRTACYLMDTRAFYKKWLDDMAADQHADGGIPHVIPDVLGGGSACGWADAAVICPWTLYLCYGDKHQLRQNYPMMRKWVEHVHATAEHGVYWNTGEHFGDWLALDAKEGSYEGATPNDFTATAFYAYSVQIMSRAASVLGYTSDSAGYMMLHSKIADFFRKEYFTPNGRLAVNTQTAHVLALMFELAPEQAQQRTVDALVNMIEQNGGHLSTGFLGTPYICHALSKYGRWDEAVALLEKEDYPSWLYPVTVGATTIWEHWDGLKPDGTLWSRDMNSFNHYAYGCIYDWLIQGLIGLNIDEHYPAYKRVFITPHLPRQWDYMRASYESIYGPIRIEVARDSSGIQTHIELPPNTSGIFTMCGVKRMLGSGKHDITVMEA